MRLRRVAAVCVLSFAITTALAAPPASCKPSGLSLSEAQSLLEATDALSAARRSDGEPSIISGSGGHHPGDFYYFVVYGTGPAARASADGGLMGYFAVQTATGRVFDTVLTEEVTGATLASVQLRLRAKHCVTDAVLKEWSDVWP